MTPPLSPEQKYRSYERAALAVTAVMLLLALTTKLIFWDWLFSTAFLLAAAYLVIAGSRHSTSMMPAEAAVVPSSSGLVLCVCLLIDSIVQVLALLQSPGLPLLIYLALAGLYGVALAARLRERGTALSRLHWSGLLQPPIRLLTIGSAVPLFCMFLPMLHYHYGFRG